MIELCIYDSDGEMHDWWINFDAADEVYYDANAVYADIEKRLTQHGGRLCEGFWHEPVARRTVIEFENDADAAAFLLRWS